MPQYPYFGFQPPPRPEAVVQQPDEKQANCDHQPQSCSDSVAAAIPTDGVFGSDRILPKAEAEEILRGAIESIKAGGLELLKCSPSVWKGFPSFSRHLGNRATEEDRDNVLVISDPWTR